MPNSRFIVQDSKLAGLVVALASLLLYTRTMAPSLGGTIDSAEFQQAANSLSIVHPTGYPLYLLLGRAWITLFPFGDPAFRVNLLSAIFAALAVWVLYATVLHLTGHLAASVGAAAFFGVQAIPWAQAGVAEINSLTTLLTGAAFLATLFWSSGRLPLYLPALACGLAASHHRTFLLYLPLLLIFGLVALRQGRTSRPSASQVAAAVVVFVLPFLAYLYIPFRGFTTAWYSNTWEGFRQEVLGESALNVIGGALGRSGLPRLRSLLFGPMFQGVPGYALLLLGLLGLSSLAPRWPFTPVPSNKDRVPSGPPVSSVPGTRYSVLLYLSAFVVGLAFAMLYDITDVEDYLAVPIFMWCVLAGVGIATLLQAISSARLRLPAPALQFALYVGIAALVVFTAYRSLHRPDLRVDFSSLDRRAYWADVASKSGQMPTGAILICDWTEWNEGKYQQQVEGWRPDIQLTVADVLLGGDGLQIDRWLAEKRPLFMLGSQAPILSRYSAAADGPLWKLTGRRSETASPPMTHPLNRRYGSNIVLLGYTLEPEPPDLTAGGLLQVTLYWKATEHLTERYVVFNHIIDEQGGKIGQLDGEPGQGAAPTQDWKPGTVITDTYPISISAQAAPGPYRLMTGLYTRLGQRRVPALNADGNSLGDYPELAEVSVR
ncbi:MAG: DUF2723 domain-containing protein [Chloroflexia bacterium]